MTGGKKYVKITTSVDFFRDSEYVTGSNIATYEEDTQNYEINLSGDIYHDAINGNTSIINTKCYSSKTSANISSIQTIEHNKVIGSSVKQKGIWSEITYNTSNYFNTKNRIMIIPKIIFNTVYSADSYKQHYVVTESAAGVYNGKYYDKCEWQDITGKTILNLNYSISYSGGTGYREYASMDRLKVNTDYGNVFTESQCYVADQVHVYNLDNRTSSELINDYCLFDFNNDLKNYANYLNQLPKAYSAISNLSNDKFAVDERINNGLPYLVNMYW